MWLKSPAIGFLSLCYASASSLDLEILFLANLLDLRIRGKKVILTGFPNHSKKGIRLLMQLILPLLMLLSQRILPIKQMALLPHPWNRRGPFLPCNDGSTMPILPQSQNLVLVPYRYRRAELRGDEGPYARVHGMCIFFIVEGGQGF